MGLTCACGKCNLEGIKDKAAELDVVINVVHSEAFKSSDLLWRSRIRKRINELKKRKGTCYTPLVHGILISEFEEMLKK